MKSILLVVIINNLEAFQECLLQSFYKWRDNDTIEILPIFNLNQEYQSVTDLYNMILDNRREDVVIFAHQDIIFLDNWFVKMRNVIDKLPSNWAILGVAGIESKYNSDHIAYWGGSLLDHTVAAGTVFDDPDADVPFWDGNKETVNVHCVDECLFIVNCKHHIRFDKTIHGFHFYATDLCLQARSMSLGVYVADLPIAHIGKYSNSLNGHNNFWHYFRKLYRKWRLQFPEVYGTYMHWNSNKENEFGLDYHLTSYNGMRLDSSDGSYIDVKYMGISKVKYD